jgi:hypothetical protein
MSESIPFEVGLPIMDRQDRSEVGHIEALRADGWFNIRWRSKRTEWVHESTVTLAPGFKPQKRPRS